MHNEPVQTGTKLGEYTTQSGNNLVYETPTGADGVVQIDNWWLVTSRGKEPTKWGTFAVALRLREAPDGHLVFENDDEVKGRWRLGYESAPPRNPPLTYPTADGRRMYTTFDDDQVSGLLGNYGRWIVRTRRATPRSSF